MICETYDHDNCTGEATTSQEWPSGQGHSNVCEACAEKMKLERAEEIRAETGMHAVEVGLGLHDAR